MKLTALLLTVSFLNVYAKGLSQNISFSGKSVPLETVFTAVKQQTGFVFLYTKSALRLARPVTINVKDIPLESFLSEVFKSQPLDYNIKGRNVFITPKSTATNSPGTQLPSSSTLSIPGDSLMKVYGVVKDDKGGPLAGATVTLKGKPAQAITNESGYFVISAQRKDEIIVSYIGFAPVRKIVETNNRAIEFILTIKNASEKEVVISTGYQKIPKERSAGSFSIVSGREVKDKSNSMNVIDRLEGLVPGMAVNYGAYADKFLIRGASSVNASRQPLFVVDGVPMVYENIGLLVNVNDVESVTVLKDATAASIWGAQAANGVVVITTKKGMQTNGRMQVSYDGFASFQGLPDYSYQKMMNSRQLVDAAKEIFDPVTFPWELVNSVSSSGTEPVVYPHEMPLYDFQRGLISAATRDRRLDSLAAISNRGQINDYLQQPGFLTNHSLSFRGGTDFYTYYGSLAYTNQKNTDRSNFDRYQVNLDQTFKVSPAIKAEVIANMSMQSGHAMVIPNLPNLNSYLPYELFKDASGNALSQAHLFRTDAWKAAAEQNSGIDLDYKPLDEIGYTSNNQTTNIATRVSAGLEIKLLKGLKYEGRFQYQRGNGDAYLFYDPKSYQVRNELVFFTQMPASPGGSPTYYLPTTGGHYQTTETNSRSWTVRNQLQYAQDLKDHELNIMAGIETRSDKTTSIYDYRRGFNYQTLTYEPYDERFLQNTGVSNPVINQPYSSSNLLAGNSSIYQEGEIRYFSLYSNLGYVYKKKYNLNASIRMDQSNLFGTDKSEQYKPIWSVGGSWRISDEAFFKSAVVNLLKARLTYGLGGNAPLPGYGSQYDILQPSNNSLFSGLGTGYTILLPGNKRLSWERTLTKNAGIDIGLWNGRIEASVDYYNKETTDLLGYKTLDPTGGWYYSYANLGKITNQGVEIQIRSQNINSSVFSWSTTFNIAYNKNKVNSLQPRSAPTVYSRLYEDTFVQGYSSYSLFGFKWGGLDTLGDPQAITAKGTKVKTQGDVTVDDLKYAGTTQPVWYGGITNQFRYKNAGISFLIIYNLGYQMRDVPNDFFTDRISRDIPVAFNNRWKTKGDENVTNMPSYVANPSENSQRRYMAIYTFADINVVSASYIKLRDITLDYRFPRLSSMLHLNNLRAYVQMNNVMLWKNNDSDIDPEYYNLSTGAGNRGNRMKPFYTVGLNVQFK